MSDHIGATETRQEAVRPLCFVIGPIGKPESDVRKHADHLLYGVIKPILEAEEFGYNVKRADEDADPGMITDRVISDILSAELVVADLTDLNANVFYELGIRHLAMKPTIHIKGQDNFTIPFDVAPHRTIPVDVTDWHSLEEARQRLAAFARAIKAPGYQVTNPVTQANASFRLRTSEDPIERTVADLQDRIAALEAKARTSPQFGMFDPGRMFMGNPSGELPPNVPPLTGGMLGSSTPTAPGGVPYLHSDEHNAPAAPGGSRTARRQ